MSFAKRLSVPIGVAAAVALIVAFGPSLLATARPSLPDVSAKQLLVKMARSDVDGLSGVVEVRSDLGLPQLPSGQEGGHHDSGIGPRDLLTGTHTLRVALAGPHKQRVAILGELAQHTFVHNGRDLWVYDSADDTAVHWQAPKEAYGKAEQHESHPEMKASSVTPGNLAQRFLDMVGPTTEVSVQGTDRVAGRDVYTLSLAPRSGETLIGQVEIFVDAETWTPLRVTVTPRGGGAPAFDVGFREISFGEPPASRFSFTPPEGAEVKRKEIRPHETGGHQGSAGEHEGAYGNGESAGRDQKSPAPEGPGRHGQSAAPWGDSGRGVRSPEILGKGWTSVLALEDVALGSYKGWLARTGSPVSGEFGQGQIVTTRLVTALVTDDGRAYIGAVTPEAIKKAAAGS